MTLYLFRFGYTPESWASLMESPEDRRELLSSRLFAFGGRLQAFWYCFGDDDGYAIAELPDNVSAAAVSVAVQATGSFRHLSLTVLMTADEMVEAITRARDFAYSKPGDMQ